MTKNAITFENRNRAVVITAPRDASAKAIIDALEITSPRAVILLFGSAAGLDDSRKTHLTTLFADGVTSVAADLGALIIDEGTRSGVTAMIGEAVARYPGKCQLLGIAPKGKIAHPKIAGASAVSDGASLEPNHSHFVLVDGKQSGCETETLFELAAAFNVPVLAILVNGGAVAKDELLQSVQRSWPVIVIEDSGRLADEVAGLKKEPSQIEDPVLAEIVEEGDLRIFPISGALEDFEQMLFSQSP